MSSAPRHVASFRVPGPCRYTVERGETRETAHVRRDWYRSDGTLSHSEFEEVFGEAIGASPSAEEQARQYCERWKTGPPGWEVT